MKNCTKCKTEKPESEFYSAKRVKSGLSAICKKCHNDIAKISASKPGNKEAKYLYDLNRRQTIPNNKEARRIYQKDHRTIEIVRFNNCVRHIIKEAFKRKLFAIIVRKSTTKATELLGCSMDKFKEHIISQLPGTMLINEYGKTWCLDHINPIGTALTKEDVLARSHYTNYQPLTISDNLRKNKNLTVPGHA